MSDSMADRDLGCGVTASFDGWCVRLWTPRIEGDHEVFLEPATVLNLTDYLRDVAEHVAAARHRRLFEDMGGGNAD